MARILILSALLIGLATAATADAGVRNVTDPEAPRALPAEGLVSVQWNDPATFTDITHSGNQWAARRGNWVHQLADHLRDSTEARLPEGERLEVTITDIRRAGTYEPWRGLQMQDVRIMREQYPPRMTLHFQRIGSDGNVIEAGERSLVDGAYLMRSSIIGSQDPLRYEKAMIDRWARSEFKDARVVATP